MKNKTESKVDFNFLLNQLIQNGVHRITRFIDEKKVVRATRKQYRGRFDNRQHDIVLTVGCSQNYRECEYIKRMKKNNKKFVVTGHTLIEMPREGIKCQ